MFDQDAVNQDLERRILQRLHGIDAEIQELMTKYKIMLHHKEQQDGKLTPEQVDAIVRVQLAIRCREYAEEEMTKFVRVKSVI